MSLASNLAAQAWTLQYRQSIFAMMEGDLAPVHNAYAQRLDRNWALVLQNPQGDGHDAEEWAFRCLGVFQIGQKSGDKKQILASREIYGRAVRELSRALSNPSLALSDGTLAAAIILGVYEILNEDGQAYWVTHSNGIQTLFRLRGPRAHLDGYGRTLLLSFRSWIVFGALLKGEKCFLEDQEWAAMGRETMKREKKLGKESPLANLVESAFQDIARCPGYLVQTKTIVSSTRPLQKEREKLTGRIKASSQILESVRRDISAGLDTSQSSTGNEFQKFIGAMPLESAMAMAEFSIEGLTSAIKFLQSLLVALEHGHSQSPTTGKAKENSGSISSKPPIVQETSLPCLSGWGRDPREVVFVRVALTMGMMVGPPVFQNRAIFSPFKIQLGDSANGLTKYE